MMFAGETNAMRLAKLGSVHLKCSRSDLAAAVDGRVTAHHRFLIDHHFGLIEELEWRVGEVLTPYHADTGSGHGCLQMKRYPFAS